MLKKIIKLLKSLNTNRNPGEIAHAVSIGFILGFVPKGNLLWVFLFILFLFVRINKGALFFITLLASAIAPSLDGLFDSLGYWVLVHPSLSPSFSLLLDIPFIAFTSFNDTLVMGSLCFGLLSYIPLYFLARLFIRVWRNSLLPKLVTIPLFKKLGNLFKIKSAVDILR